MPKPLAKINVVQAMFLFTLAVGITNHVIIVPLILHASRRDSWISALLAIPPLVVWTVVVYYVMKLTGQASLYHWFKRHYGKLVAWLVVAPLVLLCLAMLFVTIRDTTAWTKATYLQKTPYPVTVALFCFSGLFAAVAGLRTITIAAGVLLPAVVVFGFFVMDVNLQFKDYGYLLPVLTESFPNVLKGTLYTLGGLVEFVLMLGVQQHLDKKMRLSSFLLLTLAVTGLVFGPLIAAIAIFGPFEAADQRYPAFEQWRMVLVGKFISHLDFLSIYQWISGSLIRVSLAFYLMFDLLQLGRSKARIPLMAIVAVALTAAVSQSRLSDPAFFSFLGDYYFPALMYFFYAFPFVLLLLVLPKRRFSRESGQSVS